MTWIKLVTSVVDKNGKDFGFGFLGEANNMESKMTLNVFGLNDWMQLSFLRWSETVGKTGLR